MAEHINLDAPAESRCSICVRVRPFNRKEDVTTPCAVAQDDGASLLAQRDERKGGNYLRSQQASKTHYTFDATFGPDDSQEQVYARTTKPHLAKLVGGELPALTVIAYGATGAGKTHTMMGEGSLRTGAKGAKGGDGAAGASAGIIPRCVIDLFALAPAGARVRASYLEVYNERVFDLLGGGDEPGRPTTALRVCEDEKNGVVKVLGLTEEPVASAEAVVGLLKRGNARRTTEATGANDVSSRSHAVLQLEAELPGGRNRRLSLIDLAGSERASATGNRGARLQEGAHINKSLLALANCINALTDPSAPKPKFRDSKLTLLIKTALESSDVRLVVLACVGPSMASVDDTLNTLKYAHRAKELPTRDVVEEADVAPPPPAAPRARAASVAGFGRSDWGPPGGGAGRVPRRRASVEPRDRPRRRPRRCAARRSASAVARAARQRQGPLREMRRASTSAVSSARQAASAMASKLAAKHATVAAKLDAVAEAPSPRAEEPPPPPPPAARALESPEAAPWAAPADALLPVEPSAAQIAAAAIRVAERTRAATAPRGRGLRHLAAAAAARRRGVADARRRRRAGAPAAARARAAARRRRSGLRRSRAAPPPAVASAAPPPADLVARLADAEARADRWQTMARDAKETADALAAACRACARGSDDVGALRNRWELGGLKSDVDAFHERWETCIIDAQSPRRAAFAERDANKRPAPQLREPSKRVRAKKDKAAAGLA
ncbi:hypothetical protein JL722_1895 [Aureococcus anophagefferens]|nr:hypothetical protein JL722_1895 [Aureococcus anophagefferens]